MLSENIKKYRKKLKLTQEALARKANVSYHTIAKLEAKGITDPRMETLKKIADALNVSIDMLVGISQKNSR
jgi:transcriptional regulator with XRE-family HTH domain